MLNVLGHLALRLADIMNREIEIKAKSSVLIVFLHILLLSRKLRNMKWSTFIKKSYMQDDFGNVWFRNTNIESYLNILLVDIGRE